MASERRRVWLSISRSGIPHVSRHAAPEILPCPDIPARPGGEAAKSLPRHPVGQVAVRINAAQLVVLRLERSPVVRNDFVVKDAAKVFGEGMAAVVTRLRLLGVDVASGSVRR